MKKLVTVFAAIVLLSSCASIRGERIETGFGAPSTQLSEPSPYPDLEADAEPYSPTIAALPVAADPVSAPVAIGDSAERAAMAFDFTTQELYSGGAVDGAELLGQGAVIVTFVQPGCDISVDQGPSIAEAAQMYSEVIFVIIHSGGSGDQYISFAEGNNLVHENIVHLQDDRGALSQRFGIDAYPSTLLVDLDGRASTVTGAMSEDGLDQALDIVLGNAAI